MPSEDLPKLSKIVKLAFSQSKAQLNVKPITINNALIT